MTAGAAEMGQARFGGWDENGGHWRVSDRAETYLQSNLHPDTTTERNFIDHGKRQSCVG